MDLKLITGQQSSSSSRVIERVMIDDSTGWNKFTITEWNYEYHKVRIHKYWKTQKKLAIKTQYITEW
jgi:tagatose-1,6-bisphosphate aldolase non-catalytic subunit AgaZ/GatZ